MFSIDFLQNSHKCRETNTQIGEIVIGEFREFFHSSLSCWTQEQYLKQWKEGINRIVCINQEKSSLITDMYDPNSSNIIQWWVLHRDTESVRIRNELLFLGDLKQPFIEEDIYNYIEKRAEVNKDGKKILEWEVSISDLRDFYSKISDYKS